MNHSRKWSFFWAFMAFLFSMTVILLITGCAAKQAPPPFSIWHPFRDTTETVKHLQSALTAINIFAFVIFLGSFGLLFVSGLSWLTKIIAPVAGVVAAGTLAGVIALPFLPWAIGITLAGLAGYEGYRLYQKRKVKA